MPQVIHARGPAAVALATRLLQRLRLAQPEGGMWEAADVQWWWRMPRPSDALDLPFWVDADGEPVAGVYVSSWKDGVWQCDPLLMPASPAPNPVEVWEAAEQLLAALPNPPRSIQVPLAQDDALWRPQVQAAGFAPGEVSGVAWMDAVRARTFFPDGPPSLPAGFRFVDRATPVAPGSPASFRGHTGDSRPKSRWTTPHPMIERNGPDIEDRLRSTSLYQPGLDLGVLSPDGEPAAYALFWYDPVTDVGLVEPVRVAEAFYRRGIARAMVAEGVRRLVECGARRLKIGFGSDAARGVYEGVGFEVAAFDTFWARNG